MSGYLSRIVQSARGASPQIRPLAGSIFGAPAEDEHSSNLNEASFVVDAVTPAQQSEPSYTQPPANPNRPAATRSAETDIANYKPLQPIQQRSHETLVPSESLLTPSRSHQPSAEIPLTGNPQATNQHVFPLEHSSSRIVDSAEPVSPHRAPGSTPSAPTAPDSVTHRVEPIPSQDSAPPVAGLQPRMPAPQLLIPTQSALMTRAQQQSLRDQRSQPAQQQPGIEIHIGRIEVLAVQPPAPPAPAPRRDRTTSLADYLAGRNGRRS